METRLIFEPIWCPIYLRVVLRKYRDTEWVELNLIHEQCTSHIEVLTEKPTDTVHCSGVIHTLYCAVSFFIKFTVEQCGTN